MFNKNTHMVQLPVPGEVINGGEFLIQQGLGVSGHYFGCAAALPGTVVRQNSFPTAGAGSCPFLPPLRRRAAKTDRHSKIYTSQGPRDRRVRLSIGIARRFFDLQEMLGFDKPSKTLDWLLTKSKSAIKDLVQSAAADQTRAEKSELEKKSKGKSAAETSDQTAAATTTKESRAKARDRARARTREKKMMMSNQIVNSSSERNPIFPIQYMNNNQIVHEVCTISSGNSSWPHLHGQIRKSKNPPIWGFHQNLLSSRDLGPMANENWDHTTSFASSIFTTPVCHFGSAQVLHQ